MTRWDIDRAEGVLWIAGEAAKSLTGSMKKETGVCFIEHLAHSKNHNFRWCTTEQEMEKVGNFLVKRFSDKKFSDSFVKKYKLFDSCTIKQLNKFDKLNLSKFSNKQVLSFLQKATNIYIR